MVYGPVHQKSVPLSFSHQGHSSFLEFVPSSSDFCRSLQSYSLVSKIIYTIHKASYHATNNGDWESHHQDTRDGAHATNHFAKRRHGGDVTVSDLITMPVWWPGQLLSHYRGHGDERPPVRVQHGVELSLRGDISLKHEGQRGEDQNLRHISLILERRSSVRMLPQWRQTELAVQALCNSAWRCIPDSGDR